MWTDDPGLGEKTVLCVAASDPEGLPFTSPEDDGFAMIEQLGEYLPGFYVGTRWGESADIDWTRTVYTANSDARLFLNEPGSENWRPSASCDGISNLFFAGDFCMTDIDMATVEAAVMSGLDAAQLVVERRGVGSPVDIVYPSSFPPALFVGLRYALAPQAFAAKVWSMFSDAVGAVGEARPGSLNDRQRRESWRTWSTSARSGLRIRRELVGLLARRVGDAIQDPLGFVELGSARGRHSCEAVGIVVIDQEQRPDPWITDRQRGREGQDAVADVLLTSAAERFETTLVADVVAAVVEHPEKVSVLAEPLGAGAEHRADLEHRAGVLTGDAMPILEPEGLAPHPPLHALGRTEASDQLGDRVDRERVVGHGRERIGDEVPRGHHRRETTELGVDRGDATSLVGLIEDVVDDQ